MANADEKAKQDERWLGLLLDEYRALKSEQLSRIGFRDNMIYTTVAAVGGLVAVALGGIGKSEAFYEAFLLIPWVTAILGWTYLVNDDKITSIRQYIDEELRPRIREMLPEGTSPLDWETYHRKDARRSERKGVQLAIDLITFVVSGVGALAAYLFKAPRDATSYGYAGVEALLLLFLAYQFVTYSSRATRR